MLTEALAREVREETGLEVLDAGSLLYVVHHDHSEESGQTVAFVFEGYFFSLICCRASTISAGKPTISANVSRGSGSSSAQSQSTLSQKPGMTAER